MSRLVYLACPYSHPDPAVRRARFEAANRCAATLMQAGVFVFSPISHTHPIAEAGDLPLGWDFWEPYDRLLIGACGALYVLMLDGWRESRGVTAEIAIARDLGLEIEYLEPEQDEALAPPHHGLEPQGPVPDL